MLRFALSFWLPKPTSFSPPLLRPPSPAMLTLLLQPLLLETRCCIGDSPPFIQTALEDFNKRLHEKAACTRNVFESVRLVLILMVIAHNVKNDCMFKTGP